MGSMFKITYNLTLKRYNTWKSFIDELRCRNGNLEIVSSVQDTNTYELYFMTDLYKNFLQID